MSDSKHTPGPWEFIVEDGSRKIVAPSTNERLRTRETLMCDLQYYPWCPDSDADWRLIAAAPKLKEALEHVVRRLQMDIDDGSRPDQWSMEDLVRTMEKALEAACGESL